MWIFLLIACLLWSLFFTLLLLVTEKKNRVRNRLDAIALDDDPVERDELSQPSFGERVIIPLTEMIYKTVSGVSTGNVKQNIEKKLRMVGKTGPRAVEQWLSLRLIPGIVLPVVLGLSTLQMGVPLIKAIALTGMLILLVQGAMTFYLVRGIRIRKNSIE